MNAILEPFNTTLAVTFMSWSDYQTMYSLNLAGGADIDIIFTRNLPVNVLEIAQIINQLRGIVSDETLLAQIPFVNDVAAEYEKVKAQKEENISIYSFAHENTDEAPADREEADE